MNILYGVNGFGMGHCTRSKEIIRHLIRENHSVLVLTSGRAYPILKKIAPAVKIEGIPLMLKNGRVSTSHSFYRGSLSMLKNLRKGTKIRRKIARFHPDICITDFEPYTTLISYIYRLPLISIGNHHIVNHLKIPIHKKLNKDYFIMKYITNMCTLGADKQIILSLANRKKKIKNGIITGPIIRQEIIKLNPKYKNYIVVYGSQKDSRIISALKEIPEKFIVYGFEHVKKDKNLIFRKNGPSFVKDIENCKAIIGTTGFSLVSEAIYLKKPYFGMPLKNHFEQMINAQEIKKLGMGAYSENPEKEEIIRFLSKLNDYKKNMALFKTDNKKILAEIDKAISYLDKQ